MGNHFRKDISLSTTNASCIKFRNKHSSNTALCLLRNLMHQTLGITVPIVQCNVDELLYLPASAAVRPPPLKESC